MKESPDITDRLSIRERPTTLPVMYQSWGKLLFIHWQLPVEALRPLIPEPLMIDTFGGKAWIGVTPFAIWGARPVFLPSLPGISNFLEINVRTYVHLNGVPGVWFFSLDANRLLAVLGARTFFRLPYYNASISLKQERQTIVFNSIRSEKNSSAKFNAAWKIDADMLPAEAGSLNFFLVERYCFYTISKKKLYRCRVFHRPWPLHEVSLLKYKSSMIEANGLPAPGGEPLLHGGGPVNVEIWALQDVSTG
jgi:uncharacterized protein